MRRPKRPKRMTIGILALQGDVREHSEALRRMGVTPVEVRLPKHLATVDRLIIPGGESTAIGRLLTIYDLMAPIRERALAGNLAIWGTCAGAILLARDVLDQKQGGQPGLGLMDIVVRRNAFGSQLDSFELPLDLAEIGPPALPGVFIRAPRIERAGRDVTVLGRLDDGGIVAARQGRLLATTFHPELTEDDRVQRYFLEL